MMQEEAMQNFDGQHWHNLRARHRQASSDARVLATALQQALSTHEVINAFSHEACMCMLQGTAALLIFSSKGNNNLKMGSMSSDTRHACANPREQQV